jgi:hypothetical protein
MKKKEIIHNSNTYRTCKSHESNRVMGLRTNYPKRWHLGISENSKNRP